MKGLENNAAELFRLMDRVRKAWQSVTPCEHLSKSQFGTLMAIAHHGRMPGQSCTPSQEHGALTLTALAGAMHQSLPALSQRVSALEAQGYVEGRTVMEVAYRRFGSILSRSIDYLGPQNFETLLHLLGELAIALEQAVAAQEEERESDSK